MDTVSFGTRTLCVSAPIEILRPETTYVCQFNFIFRCCTYIPRENLKKHKNKTKIFIEKKKLFLLMSILLSFKLLKKKLFIALFF